MDYKTYKIIEEYFKLEEKIQDTQKKIEAVSLIQQGVLNLESLVIIMDELILYGSKRTDCFETKELYKSLNEEHNTYITEKNKLKEIINQMDINIDRIVTERMMTHNKRIFLYQ